MSRFETDDYMMIVVLVCLVPGYRYARRKANMPPVQVLFIVFEVVGNIGTLPATALGLEVRFTRALINLCSLKHADVHSESTSGP